jgi:endonuclease/exonuclease/phosphatase family metal-dependent hydrolase
MTIYSWNMLFSNSKLDQAFEFIRDTDWDIFCLQEVPESFVERLRTLPHPIAVAAEGARTMKGKRFTLHLVTLSKHPITDSRTTPMPFEERAPSLREKMFLNFMSYVGLFTRAAGHRHSLWATVQTPTGPLQVLNMHLSLRNPRARFNEFSLTVRERADALPTVVCGDFNVLESIHITPINYLRSGTFGDFLFFRRERGHLERHFLEHKLLNPLRGKKTHPLSQSQLDHILISNTFSTRNAEVITNRRGSDHCPIRVEVT